MACVCMTSIANEINMFLSYSSGIPISTLEPVILEEGQSFRVAAICRAVGLPPPWLSWETDVPGQIQNKSSEDGVVTSQYFLHPLRSMNGRKLDCLVWHPALDQPRRLSSLLVVHCESTLSCHNAILYGVLCIQKKVPGCRFNLPHSVLCISDFLYCVHHLPS